MVKTIKRPSFIGTNIFGLAKFVFAQECMVEYIIYVWHLCVIQLYWCK